MFVVFFCYFLNDFESSVKFNISYQMKTNVTNEDIKIGHMINNTRTHRILNLVKNIPNNFFKILKLNTQTSWDNRSKNWKTFFEP